MLLQQLKRLSTNTLIYGVGQVLNKFFGFLLLPLFTKYLTPKEYGISAILGIIGMIITAVFSLGLGASTGVSYFEGNNKQQKETTIWTAFSILIVSVFILIVCTVSFSDQISFVAFQTKEYHYLIVLSLIGTGLSMLAQPLQFYLQFEEKAKLFIILTAISTLLSLCLSVFLVVVLRRGVLGVVESQLITNAVMLPIFIIPVIFNLSSKLSLRVAKELLRLGIPLIPSFAFLFIIQQSNQYILQHYKGLDVVGIYSIGFRLGMVLSLITGAFSKAWYPFFMSFVEKQEEAKVLFGKILTYYVFGFGSLSLLFYIWAKPVVMIFTQPPFYQAYQVVGLAATAQFLGGMVTILLPGIYFAKELKYISLVQGVSAVIAVLINVGFVIFFGLVGAGIALVLSFFCMVVFQQVWNWFRREKYLKIHYEWGRILKFSLIYIGFIILILLPRDFSLFMEAMMSVIITLILPVILYSSLPDEKEKRKISEIICKYRKVIAHIPQQV